MASEIASQILRGAAAGLAGSVMQSAVGKVEDELLLPDWENADIAPRLVDRLAKKTGFGSSETLKWVAGTAFHLGYGAVWGAAYALAEGRRRVPPVAGGLLLGGLIYGITFPRWGGAVRMGVERPPEARTRRMTFVAASVAVAFGVTTALVYDRLAREREPVPPRRRVGFETGREEHGA